MLHIFSLPKVLSFLSITRPKDSAMQQLHKWSGILSDSTAEHSIAEYCDTEAAEKDLFKVP